MTKRSKAIEAIETEVEFRVGDVRFLAEARAALADLRKLWGLDAAKAAGDEENAQSTLYSVEFGPEAAPEGQNGGGDGVAGRPEMVTAPAGSND